jgi:hypothetical protein
VVAADAAIHAGKSFTASNLTKAAPNRAAFRRFCPQTGSLPGQNAFAVT